MDKTKDIAYQEHIIQQTAAILYMGKYLDTRKSFLLILLYSRF